MKKYFLIFLIVIFSIIFYFSKSYAEEEEKLTIVTYYPSPYGIYNRLVTQTLGVGDTNDSGNIDNSDSPDPATNPGDLWVAGNVTIGTNSSFANRGNLNVKGKVGIGTTTPQAKLDVAGEVKISNTGLNCNSNTAGVLRYNNNQIEYCDGANWKAAFGGGCPAGFVDTGYGYCIQTAENAESTFFTAVKTCANLGGRLCTGQEWYLACANNKANNMTDNWEWVGDIWGPEYAPGCFGAAAPIVGNGRCTKFGSDNTHTTKPIGSGCSCGSCNPTYAFHCCSSK